MDPEQQFQQLQIISANKHSMKSLQAIIAPSILSADFAFLFKQCQEMIDSGADSLHIDIMDGHFVPNLSIGAPVIASLRKSMPNVYFDCHLMVTNPLDYILPLKKCAVNNFTFHYEAVPTQNNLPHSKIEELCDAIHKEGMRVGLSVKPGTEINQQIEQLVHEQKVDQILIMTVEPGFGGQKFMSNMMHKVKHLRNKFPFLDIQVDGGITVENIQVVAESGANFIVSGTGIFGVIDKKKAIANMKHIVTKYI